MNSHYKSSNISIYEQMFYFTNSKNVHSSICIVSAASSTHRTLLNMEGGGGTDTKLGDIRMQIRITKSLRYTLYRIYVRYNFVVNSADWLCERGDSTEWIYEYVVRSGRMSVKVRST